MPTGSPHISGPCRRAPIAALAVVCVLLLAFAALAEDRRGASGLPLPRWASLAATPAHLRTGPGHQFPIRWILVRQGLPLRIVDEVDVWRKVEDPDGDVGWIHASLLSSRRTVMVVGEIRALRRTPSTTARVVARLEPGVIGRLLSCEAVWCLVEVADLRGWLRREEIWGVDAAPPAAASADQG